MLKLGVIGYGGRISGVIRQMQRFDEGVTITAITDPNPDSARERLGDEGKDVRFYEAPEQMFAKEELDGVAIGTRCGLHAKYAIEVAKTNLPLFLEKPVATNMEDVIKLKRAFEDYKGQVVVSFPLRLSRLVTLAREMIDADELGEVNHVQAYNNVTYGEVYFMRWYRDENETGGLFLQKATHDFDYLSTLVAPRKPVTIAAMASKQIYTGDMEAGLSCNDCPKPQDCLESPFHRYHTRGITNGVEESKLQCGFATDTGNEDSSSAMVKYDTGMHLVYSQNFFVKNAAGRRGARLMGRKATLEFDWNSAAMNVYYHFEQRTARHDFSGMDGHGGGDKKLALSFIRCMQKREASLSPIEAGIQSAYLCIKARESAATDTFQKLDYEAV